MIPPVSLYLMEPEDLEHFTNILRNRHYSSGYREGLFRAKSEVIQDSFDSGYEIGAKLAILELLKESFCDDLKFSESKNEFQDDKLSLKDIDKLEREEIDEKIEKIKMELMLKVPEIKIAENLFSFKENA